MHFGFALAISLLAASASTESRADSILSAASWPSRASLTTFSSGLSIQSPPNSITTPAATKNAAMSLAVPMMDSQYSALDNAEASIERSRRLSPIIFGLVAIWLLLRFLYRGRR